MTRGHRVPQPCRLCGDAHRPPAYRAYLRRRAACLGGALLYVRCTRTSLGRAARTAYHVVHRRQEGACLAAETRYECRKLGLSSSFVWNLVRAMLLLLGLTIGLPVLLPWVQVSHHPDH